MAENLDVKNIVKHLANGKLSELCLVCLSQLKEDSFESIFTLICKEKTEYCVAEALEAVCQIEFRDGENYNICIECFKTASEAYKFHLKAKQSMEIITYYTEVLLNNIQNVDTTNDNVEILCIPLSEYVPENCLFDFNLDGIGNNTEIIESLEDEDELLNPMISDKSDDEVMVIINKPKMRKKRNPMEYLSCSQCSVKYRFVAKLKKHMKISHGIDVFYCKICKTLSENKKEYDNHIKSHKTFQCTICNIIYKRYSSLVAHMKKHKVMKTLQQRSQKGLEIVCELCGAILEDEARLQNHMSRKHAKRYTCYYCGKLYKSRDAFEKHIKRHEQVWKKKTGIKTEQENSNPEGIDNCDKSKRVMCPECGKDLVNERALQWHQRLHNNDRPFICDECGRGFVSLNRRNQHAVCSHTRPSKRCPLCPALFHLRSMVNTHLKKVHLKAHKRNNRTVKRPKVLWRTETVPIQELSVELQNDILELQARDDKEQLKNDVLDMEARDHMDHTVTTIKNELEDSNLENDLFF